MAKHLIIGSNRKSTADFSQTLGLGPSMLILSKDVEFDTGHTSVHDIPDLDELRCLLDRADHVYWAMCGPEEFDCVKSYHDFLDWLKDYDLINKKVRNRKAIAHDPYQWGKNISPGADDMIFYGCSFTAGIGLDNTQDGYAFQMAKYFGKNLLNLATPGGSNGLIFDKFVRTDFVPGQMAVIQFTQPARLHYCSPEKLLRPLILANAGSIKPDLHAAFLKIYNDSFLFYELLVRIRAMIQICRTKNLKMIFWLSDYKNPSAISWLDQTYFYDMPEFVPGSWIQNYLVDKGSDNLHPGVKSNRILSTTLSHYLETIYP